METKKRMIAAWALLGALLLASVPLPAKERKGARVKVEQNDGTSISGELLMVKKDFLVVAGQAGGVIVELSEIRSVRILKKSQAGTGLLLGMIGGSVIGYALGRQSPGCQDAELTAGLSFLLIGLPAGGLGALIGSAQGKDVILNMGGKKQDLLVLKLKRLARVPDAALSSGQ